MMLMRVGLWHSGLCFIINTLSMCVIIGVLQDEVRYQLVMYERMNERRIAGGGFGDLDTHACIHEADIFVFLFSSNVIIST